ncbi:MAG: GerAB/ArcD/ProY family transporter [Caulobacteraceae bacterium]
MTKEGKFGFQEALWLLVITTSTKMFFSSPTMAVKLVGTAEWYMTLVSAAVAAVGFMFVYILLKRYPGNNIMEVYDNVFGRFLGFAFSFLLAAVLLIETAIGIREFAEVQKVYVFPKTPITFIIGAFVAVVVVLSFLGLEAIARYAKLIAFSLITAFVIIIVLSFQHYQLHRLFPIYGYGLGKTIYHGAMRSSAFGEVIIIAIIAKSLHGVKEIKKAGFISLLISEILVLVAYLAFLLTFSYFVGRELTAPMYVMSSLINYGVFFQRTESIFLFIWNLTSLISGSVLFYMVLIVYCHMFRIKDKKPLIIPFSIILLSLSMIPRGIMDVISIYRQYLMEYGWALFYLPSFIALIVAVIRKKGGAGKYV